MKNLYILVILCALLAFGLTRPTNNTVAAGDEIVAGDIKRSQCQPVPHATVNTSKYDMVELCQRCVKFTRNVEVYFYCCANRDDLQIWCVQAYEYGRNIQ